MVNRFYFSPAWFHAVLRWIPSALWAWIFKALRTSLEALLSPRWNGAIAFRSHSEERARGLGGGGGDYRVGSHRLREGKATSVVWGPLLRRAPEYTKHFVLQPLFLWVTVFIWVSRGKKAVASQKTRNTWKIGPIRLVLSMWVAMGKVMIRFRILYFPEGFSLIYGTFSY